MTHSSSADHQRIYQLYHYLCKCLAIAYKANGEPSKLAIEGRLNKSNLRRIVGRILEYDGSTPLDQADIPRFGNVTTGDVVDMLVQLNHSLKADYMKHKEPYTRVLTQEDILTVLYKLIELTPLERRELGLPAGDGMTLLQQALLVLQTSGQQHNYDMIFRVYKSAVGLDFADSEPALHNIDQVDQLIATTVQQALSYLPSRPGWRRGNEPSVSSRDETVRELTQKAQREIRRLLARSGNHQSLVNSRAMVDSYVQHYLQPAFVMKLARTVVANERLTDQFPVYLKRITIEACGPLPFADRELGVLPGDGPYPAMLHPALRRLEQQQHDRENGASRPDPRDPRHLPKPGDYELASQEASRVVAEFYIKVPEGYKPSIKRVFERLSSEDGRRVDFSLSSTGIGGTLSHVIKVINVALLADLPSLRHFFAIAHDVTSTQQIIRDNVSSPVWAHSLVKLCHKVTVGQALQLCNMDQMRFYEEFAFGNPTGQGDYCGFDFLLAQAQAALHARLQAIRNSGVDPKQYVQQFCRRTEQMMALQDGWSYVTGYPFSSLAMVGTIEREILQPNVGDRPLTKTDSYIYFEAYLSMIEVLLDEGYYRPAWRYLKRLQVLDGLKQQGLESVDPASQQNGSMAEVFSGSMIVRYLLCQAHYYYLYDTEDPDPAYLPKDCQADINREGLIQRAWRTLEQARKQVGIRLCKYVLLNEVSQGTFHPHYALLARIAFLRAKLLLFFPKYVAPDASLPSDRMNVVPRTNASIYGGRLYLLEKARLYAAADGDSESYACYAAMQCWAHLMAAFANADEDLTLPIAGREAQLSRLECLKWAKQLRDHALVSYAETGRQCYYQIKEKSGLPRQSDDFGPYRIQKIPAIYEARGAEYIQLGQANADMLVLDMDLLGVSPGDLPKMSPHHPAQTIYLFGANACYLFFARGMYLLCSQTTAEFEKADRPSHPIHWETKLTQAMRLLNMAWAIAEEGGEIHRSTDGAERILRITRSLRPQQQSHEYTSQDVESVRDLYPRRVTEIADLGKVFAAACLVLRLYSTAPSNRETLATQATQLLQALHSGNRLTPLMRALIARQHRYNGHLSAYLSQAHQILTAEMAIARYSTGVDDVQPQRDRLLKQLFAALLENTTGRSPM
ncbi:hypothetical protein ACQ4M4_22480 [Leptolyngbya sp. AN02str]|uniref:hypothetical protein n=1 Tax=Leptolyngbya sp. AN02str TaxID=3423363 RepID=UPI003D30F4A8